jgi:hypothetical protein
MIDHRIILHILYHNSVETLAVDERCAGDNEFIFFPFLKENYYGKLNGLTARQYLNRIHLLYSVFWRNN